MKKIARCRPAAAGKKFKQCPQVKPYEILIITWYYVHWHFQEEEAEIVLQAPLCVGIYRTILSKKVKIGWVNSPPQPEGASQANRQANRANPGLIILCVYVICLRKGSSKTF